MCLPGLGAASVAGQAFGVGMSTVGAFGAASAQQDTLRSQARIAEINASIFDASARQELMASQKQQEAIKLRGSQTKASQISAYAGNGIDIGVGTPVNVATSNDLITEVDANTARANGILAAWGQRIQATGMRNQARSLRATAAGISPLLAGATTLLTGAGQVAQSWYGLNKVGAFGAKPAPAGVPSFGGHESSHGMWGGN